MKRREVKGKGEKERYTQRISRRDKTAFLVHETGCLGLVHWDDPEGWDGERVGRGVQDGEHMYTHGDSCQCMAKPIQYYKVISLQLKQIKRKKRKESLPQ